jgi:hypothetical protein
MVETALVDQFERVIYPSAAVLLCLLVVLSVLGGAVYAIAVYLI